MAKLYWRVKTDGRWTWRPAKVLGRYGGGPSGQIVEDYFLQEEEE